MENDVECKLLDDITISGKETRVYEHDVEIVEQSSD